MIYKPRPTAELLKEKIMATKKKNSNYVTEKTVAKRAEEERKAAESKAKKARRIIVSGVLAVLFITAVILSGFLFDVYEYVPKATSHTSITLSDGTALHAELNGTTYATLNEVFDRTTFEPVDMKAGLGDIDFTAVVQAIVASVSAK